MNASRSVTLKSRVQFRLTEEEKRVLLDQADAAGLTLSALCRRFALARSVVANVDMISIRELRRQGGLLKKVHVESGGAYSAETANALREVRDAIGRITRSGPL